MDNRVDHFTVGTGDLLTGQAAMAALLGAEVPLGSKHDAMSTHNCVCQAGHESFFELIAVDPGAPDPGRVRWFTLDNESTRARIAERPRALCWVVNTPDLDAVVAGSPIDLGEVVHFQRGERTWRLTVPTDGSLPMGGLVPAFIEWSPGPHPSTGQKDIGVTLRDIRLTHPEPERVLEVLTALRVDHLASVSEGVQGLAFEVSAPAGRVVLD
ncbi:MAG: VOC family protein [Pseudomonadota bacterium]